MNANDLKNRGGWIASIRGLSALLVYVSHLILLQDENVKFIIGRIGVTSLFFISGYLAVDARFKRSSGQYLFNRFIRLYPIYWLLLFLTCIVNLNQNLTLLQIIANMTLFQEFLGQSNIIGASWMLPIQITFFIMIAIFGVNFLLGKEKNNKNNIWIVSIIGILSIITGILRWKSGEPFPTAFFLLNNVALLGACMNKLDKKMLTIRRFIILMVIFEISLVAAAYFSYRTVFFRYIIAYNIGFLITIISKIFYWNAPIFQRLGNIGFTFFLGAGIPLAILKRFINTDISFQNQIIVCLIQFPAVLLLAWLVTRYVEIPLLKWSKQIEGRIPF